MNWIAIGAIAMTVLVIATRICEIAKLRRKQTLERDRRSARAARITD